MRSTRAPERSSALVPWFVVRLVPGLVLGLGVGLGLAGCRQESVATYVPITEPSQLYLNLALSHRAITLSTTAPYDTLRLTATPLDATGAPIAGLPAPTFRLVNVSDSTRVRVTPEGLLQARGVAVSGEGVRVFAELAVAGNIRHADTARVMVKDAPPQAFASLILDPPSTDSAAWAVTGTSTTVDVGNFFLPLARFVPVARAVDNAGDSIPGIAVEYVSLDSAIATTWGANGSTPIADIRRLATRRPGQARIVARAMVYGVARADTLVYLIRWPAAQTIDIVPGPDGIRRFDFTDVRLAPYGVVLFRNMVAGDPVGVTFEDTTNVRRPPPTLCENWLERTTQIARNQYGQPPYTQHCGTGNVLMPGRPPLGLNGTPPTEGNRVRWTIQARQFTAPGVYRYHTSTGTTGRIVVTADPDPTALP